MSTIRFPLALSLAALLGASGCADGGEATVREPCEQECMDRVALRAVRETLKLVFNLTLQGNPTGAQDETTECSIDGQARVFGEAESNSMHGATEVSLTYELEGCIHLERDEEPEENYGMRLTGIVEQSGTIAVQPSATSALIMSSDSVTLEGFVYDPPLDYLERDCELRLGQDGMNVSGLLCGREVGLEL